MTTPYNRPSVLDDLKSAEKLSKKAFLVYRALQRMAVVRGNGFRAKHATIAELAGCSISTVQRAIRELVDCSIIGFRSNAVSIAGRNYRISNSYFILSAARWCFIEQLKRVAKLVKAALKPVSVKADWTIGTGRLRGCGKEWEQPKTVNEYGNYLFRNKT